MRNIFLTLIALVLASCGGEMPTAGAPANANLTPPEFAWEEEAPVALDLGGPEARYAVPGDERWESMNEVLGTNAPSPLSMSVPGVSAMVRYGDYLYIGGAFTIVKDVFANNIARLHIPTGKWESLGSDMDSDTTVFALAVDANGDLYAGGDFTTIGGVTAKYIAKWDGTSWSPLGSGMSYIVYALTVDTNGNLYAGGEFTTAGGTTANHIAKWDGATWSALGSGRNSIVRSLAVNASGTLYVGGEFTNESGHYTGVVQWDGSSWTTLGEEQDGRVFALAIDGNENIYAGGEFSVVVDGDSLAWGIARWDGTSWSPLGTGVSTVYTLAVDANGDLYAGGDFTTAGGVSANNIAKWNGASWSALGDGIGSAMFGYPSVAAIAFDAEGVLYAGGAFMGAGDTAARRIAKWDGDSWSAIGYGIDIAYGGYANAIAFAASGNTVVGGSFLAAAEDGGWSYDIAEREGSSWGFPYNGLWSNGSSGTVFALVTDTKGDLYAGGGFSTIAGVESHNIAKWDGAAWSALGSGMNGNVRALMFDINGNLYAGGDFTTAGGTAANHIAKWDGTSWSPLGSGMNSSVFTLAFDTSGNLYAGGGFTTADSVSANHIAKWNGSSWSAIGEGLDGAVRAISLSDDGTIYLIYHYDDGFNAFQKIEKWDGSTWEQIGGYSDSGMAIALDEQGTLYASASGSLGNIAKWNGNSWSNLGGGTDGPIYTISFDKKGNLWAGGEFSMAGGKVSPLIAMYRTIIDAGESCFDGTECDSGNCVDSTCCYQKTCDDNNPCTIDSCAVSGDGTCTNVAGNAETICRASAGVCDVAENCDGENKDCPTDMKLTSECRPVIGVCDVAESCDGVTDDCPENELFVNTTPCRISTGDCDTTEYCTGLDVSCPGEDYTIVNGDTCDDANALTENDTCFSGTCAGDLISGVCGNEVVIAPLPYTATGTTVGRPNALNAYGPACGDAGKPSPDIIYAFTVETGVEYLIEVAPEASYDVTINLLGACQNNEVCLGVANGGGEGDAEAIIYSSASPRTIYIALEGNAKNEVGSYEIRVTTVEASDDTPPTDADTVDEIVIEPDDEYVASEADIVELTDDAMTDDMQPDEDTWVHEPPPWGADDIVYPDDDFATTDDALPQDKDIIATDADTFQPDLSDAEGPDETVDESVDESVDNAVEDTDSIISDEQPPVDADTAKPNGNSGCGCTVLF